MSLANDLRKFAELSNQKMETVIKSSLIRVGSSVIVKTPVDKGLLINNWMSAYGTIDATTTMAISSGGADSRQMLTEKVKGLQIGEAFYFTNSLPYAARIEYEGHSMKAPSGMLRVSIAAFQNIVNEEIAKVKK